MSILLDSGHGENNTRLCSTDVKNSLINKRIEGFLSGFPAESIHRIAYPGTGEGENKITNAYGEALRTVGYGRLEKPCTTYYNNPFDPRLIFNGLGHLLTVTDGESTSLSKARLTQNVFLALENSDSVMDGIYNPSRNFYQDLRTSISLDLFVDPNRYKLFPEIDGNVSDDGSEDCKLMFSKIASPSVRNLWVDTPRTTEGDEDLTGRVSDQVTAKTDKSKDESQFGAGDIPTKDKDGLGKEPPPKNKIRYSYKRLEGKKKPNVELARNEPMSPEQSSTYDDFAREIELVVSEESDEEDHTKMADPTDAATEPTTGDPDTANRVTAVEPDFDQSQPKCPKEDSRTEDETSRIQSIQPRHQASEPEVSMVGRMEQGTNKTPCNPCRDDSQQTATEGIPVHVSTAEAKIQEFKQDMEKIIAGCDIPKTSLEDLSHAEYSVDTIVAKSQLRPSVPSFYPGFNKALGLTDQWSDHVIEVKTSTTTHTTRPPPGIPLQQGGQGHLNWPQAQHPTGHVPTGTFQTHHAGLRTDFTQKPLEFRPTLNNLRTCNQPAATMNKVHVQPTQAAAALLMANCLQQPTRRDVPCNPPQPLTHTKPFTDVHQFQHISYHQYQGFNTTRNPPPGFTEVSHTRNRDHAVYRSEVHQQHALSIQQQYRFPAEQGYQQTQQAIGSRFSQPQVQNLHQHQLVTQHQLQQQQHHHQQHQHQPQNNLHGQQQFRPQQQAQHLHHPHPPLHPLQPQQHFLNPDVPPFQYFNKMQNGSQQSNIGMRTGWHPNIPGENTNCNNANVNVGEENSKPSITFNSSSLTDGPVLNGTEANNRCVNSKLTVAPSDLGRIRRMSMSAESIPSLVNDGNRENSKDKHKISKFRSRRSNLVRIYPSKDLS